MSKQDKLNILLDIGDENSSLFDIIFKDLECEIYSDESAISTFDIIITENKEFESKANQKIIYIVDESINGKNFISHSSLRNPLTQKSIRRFCGENSSLELEHDLAPKEIKSFKITNRFSVGYYLDHISLMANNFGLDPEIVGSDYLKAVTTFLSNPKSLPISVDIIVGEEYFAFQLHAVASGLKFELISKDNKSNLLDIYSLSSSKEFVIGLYYYKNDDSSSYLVSLDKSFENSESTNVVYDTLTKIVDYSKADAITQEKKKESSLSKIKKIIDFLKKSSINSNNTIEEMLETYPDKTVVKALTEEDLNFITRVLGETSIYDAISSTIIGHKEDLLNSDELPIKIASAIEEMDFNEFSSFFESEDEAFEKIKSVTQNLTEDINLVKGSIEEGDSITRVSGTREDLGEDSTLIQGSSEDSYNVKDDLWKVKRLEVATKIKEELSKLKFSGVIDKEDIQDRVKNSLVESFDLEGLKQGREISEKMNNSLMESAAIDDIGVKISNEKSAEHIFLRLENDRYKGQIEKKNDQILRMKRIIDTMKKDFVAKKEAEKVIKENALLSDEQSLDQKLASANLQIEVLMKEVKNKDLKLEHHEQSHLHTLKNRDHRISLLEDKVSDLISKNVELTNSENSEGNFNEISHKVKQLENQLVIADKRVQMISKKYDGEIKNRAQLETTHQEFKRLYIEEKSKVESLVERIKQAELKSNQAQKDAESDNAKERIKELEASLKESQIETKKFEQKLKFMTSQLTEMDKKLKKAGGGSSSSAGGGSAGNAPSDKRVKQLEKNLEKINLLKAKAEEDLIKKKEEVHKLKQDNMITMNKIGDLERKLAKYEKNAA